MGYIQAIPSMKYAKFTSIFTTTTTFRILRVREFTLAHIPSVPAEFNVVDIAQKR